MAFFNTRLKVTVIIGAIWMVITLVFYLLVTNEPTSTQNLGLFFLLFCEALTIGGLVLQEVVPRGTGPMFRMGSYVVVPAFGFLSILFAFVHAMGWATSTTWLVLLELIVIGVFVSIEILLYLSSKSTADTDRITSARMGVVMDMRARLDNLAKLQNLPQDLTAKLNRVAEEVRYFDKNSSVSSDTTIGDKIGLLEGLLAQSAGDVPPGTDKLLDELLALTKIRGREAADAQRGGF
ncbi:MAG: hypothetical protein LBF38_06245 [Deltaproteobacteria bacterium]|jgi:hypothetical protein|nr:hypothetical protein [Deltaproteobacteria bacterium]